MLINTAVGTGMLNLPNKIASASITVSIITIVLVGIILYICAQQFLDVVQRTHMLLKYEELQKQLMTSKNDQQIKIQTTEIATETVKQEEEENKIEGDAEFKLDLNQPMPNVQLSCSFLCQKYYGKIGFYIYQIASAVLIFFTNVSYTNVTASSLSSIIPMNIFLDEGEVWQCDSVEDFSKSECNKSYWIYVGVLCIVCICLMWFDLSSQAWLQNIFTVCRLGVLVLVCIVTIYCLCTTPYEDAELYQHNNYINPNTIYVGFDFKSFGLMASNLQFSLIFHHGMSIILQPVKAQDQDKLQIGLVINSIILTGLTILITLPGALYFGPYSIDLVTLNFTQWNGKDFTGGKSTVLATIIKYTMRILPPIYIIFCIPVRGLIMSGNLLELFPDRLKVKKSLQVSLNLLCILPSVIIGGIFKNLTTIINFASLFGYGVIFVGPVLLIKCNQVCPKYNIPSRYSWFNKSWIAWIMIIWMVFSIVFTIYSLVV